MTVVTTAVTRHSELPELAGGHRLRCALFELAVATPRPDVLSAFYEAALGLHFSRNGDDWLGIGRGRRLLLTEGAAKTLVRATYAVEEAATLEAISARAAAADIPFVLEPISGLCGDALSMRDPDGNRITFGMLDTVAGSGNSAATATGAAALPARLQHVVFASRDIEAMLEFYRDILGFGLSDRVVDDNGVLKTVFLRCGEDHHSLAIFAASKNWLDHWCLEAGEWGLIRDWADHFSRLDIPLQWGPGRHGPGNNLFLFIHDTDGNWVEISAELEKVSQDRPVGVWPHAERTLNAWGMGKLRA